MAFWVFPALVADLIVSAEEATSQREAACVSASAVSAVSDKSLLSFPLLTLRVDLSAHVNRSLF